MSELNFELTRGFILDLDPQFYAGHTEAELLDLGYTDVQLVGISEALARFNLAFKAEPAAPEAPEPPPAEALSVLDRIVADLSGLPEESAEPAG